MPWDLRIIIHGTPCSSKLKVRCPQSVNCQLWPGTKLGSGIGRSQQSADCQNPVGQHTSFLQVLEHRESRIRLLQPAPRVPYVVMSRNHVHSLDGLHTVLTDPATQGTVDRGVSPWLLGPIMLRPLKMYAQLNYMSGFRTSLMYGDHGIRERLLDPRVPEHQEVRNPCVQPSCIHSF